MANLDLIGELDEALKTLKPVDNPYDDFYTRAMQRIQARQSGTTINAALITICWLFFAKRTLRQKELLHALASSGSNPQAEKRLPTVPHVLSMCAGLVVVDEIHDTVSLFHKTLYDFLEKKHAEFLPLGDQTVGTTCVQYLTLDDFADGPRILPGPESLHFACQPPDRARYAYGDLLVHYPLYEYAQRHWHDHIRESNLETADIVTNFLADSNKLSASCQTLESLKPRTTALHIAVQFPLDRSLERQLELYQPAPNVKDSFGRSPLSYAAELNNVAAIEKLINAGATLDFEDACDTHAWVKPVAHTPLAWAAFKGHLLACETLLKYGAGVNYRDSRGASALSYAAEGGSEAVALFLLRNGGLVDPLDFAKQTPLGWACAAGSGEVASLLLDRGANINQVDQRGITPLLAAVRAGSEPLISLLVARGADVNSVDYSDNTPLSRAVEAKLVESVRLLLRQGADTNGGTKPPDPKTPVAHPLTQATKSGSKEIVELLISAGSDVNSRDRSQISPLAYAAKNGWLDIVQLMLERGADPNNTPPGAQSALSYAVQTGSVELVEVLLKHGADVNRPNGRFPYCEPLYLALGMVHGNSKRRQPANERMFKLLLSNGANPDRMHEWESWRENLLDSPLLYALQHLPTGDALTGRLVRSLLEHGARTDVVTRKGVSVSECAKNHSKDGSRYATSIWSTVKSSENEISTEEYRAFVESLCKRG